jgi:hypothetical protein
LSGLTASLCSIAATTMRAGLTTLATLATLAARAPPPTTTTTLLTLRPAMMRSVTGVLGWRIATARRLRIRRGEVRTIRVVRGATCAAGGAAAPA